MYLPQRYALSFEVRFESARQPLGEVDVQLPIMVPQLFGQAAGWAQQQMSPGLSAEFSVLLQVTKGPTCNIHLRAKVFALSLDISKNRFQFHDIVVGQCQVETVRLYNWFRVPCKWFISVIKSKVKHRRHGTHNFLVGFSLCLSPFLLAWLPEHLGLQRV